MGSSFDRSHLMIPRAIGFIGGMLAPTLLIGSFVFFGEESVRRSISYYYFGPMREVLTSALIAVAVLMFIYSGIDHTVRWSTNLAGLCLIGVAWFPTNLTQQVNLVYIIHHVSAGGFFIVTAYISYFLFPRETNNDSLPKKTIMIHRFCAMTIFICLIAAAGYKVIFRGSESAFIFSAEGIALTSFCVSWITRGQMIS